MKEENFIGSIEEKLNDAKNQYKYNEDEIKLIDRLIHNIYLMNKKCLRKGKVKKRKEQIYNDNRYTTELLVDKRDKLIIETEELDIKIVCKEIQNNVDKEAYLLELENE